MRPHKFEPSEPCAPPGDGRPLCGKILSVMRRVILGSMDFRRPAAGWTWPAGGPAGVEITRAGALQERTGSDFVVLRSFHRLRPPALESLQPRD